MAVTAEQVQFWLAHQEFDAAYRWAQENSLIAEVEPDPINVFEHISLAQVLANQGRAEPDGKTWAKSLELTNRHG